jgi:hypothetical protein
MKLLFGAKAAVPVIGTALKHWLVNNDTVGIAKSNSAMVINLFISLYRQGAACQRRRISPYLNKYPNRERLLQKVMWSHINPLAWDVVCKDDAVLINYTRLKRDCNHLPQ